jgi:hypothetical protein
MKWMVFARDLMSILVGAFGLIHSQLTGNVYPELLAIYTTLLGSPVVLRLLEKRSDNGKSDGPTASSSR